MSKTKTKQREKRIQLAFMRKQAVQLTKDEVYRTQVAKMDAMEQAHRDEVSRLLGLLHSIRASTADIHDTYEHRGNGAVDEALDLVANIGRIIQRQVDDELFRRGDPGYRRCDASHWKTLDERIQQRALADPHRMDPVTGVEPWPRGDS
jgi:hypothetical protein